MHGGTLFDARITEDSLIVERTAVEEEALAGGRDAAYLADEVFQLRHCVAHIYVHIVGRPGECPHVKDNLVAQYCLGLRFRDGLSLGLRLLLRLAAPHVVIKLLFFFCKVIPEHPSVVQ